MVIEGNPAPYVGGYGRAGRSRGGHEAAAWWEPQASIRLLTSAATGADLFLSPIVPPRFPWKE